MSHLAEIKTQIKDIEALRSACQELGLALLPNAEARGYYENKTKGDYVIRLRGRYDIAINKQPDGSYGLTTDLWDGPSKRRSVQNTGSSCGSTGSTKRPSKPGRRGCQFCAANTKMGP